MDGQGRKTSPLVHDGAPSDNPVVPQASSSAVPRASTSAVPRASTSAVPQASTSAVSQASTSAVAANPRRSARRPAWRFSRDLVPLTSLHTDKRARVIAVVAEVIKLGDYAMLNTTYDIFKLVDESCSDPDAPQTNYKLKVFHNNGPAWPVGGCPREGCVLYANSLKVEVYNDQLEGKVYSTAQIATFDVSDDDDDLVTYHTNSIHFSFPRDLRKAVVALNRWWLETGDKKAWGVSCIPVPAPSNHTVADLKCSSGVQSKLYCMVTDKVISYDRKQDKSVLRVCDGTRTRENFHKYNLDDLRLMGDSSEVIVRAPGNFLVDILVIYNAIPKVVCDLQKGDFICIDKIKVGKGSKLFVHIGEGSMEQLERHDVKVLEIQSALREVEHTFDPFNFDK